MSLATFAPPLSVKRDELLPVGARVSWSHRAAVMRRRRISEEAGAGTEWVTIEGVEKFWRPPMSKQVDDAFGLETDEWYQRPVRGGLNKSVLVWPEEGEGVVIGFVRRGVGESYSSSRGHGMFGDGDDFEPGGFAAHGFVPLYAVKSRLEGLDYSLVPTWAASRVTDGSQDAQDAREASTRPAGSPDPVIARTGPENAFEPCRCVYPDKCFCTPLQKASRDPGLNQVSTV